MDNTASETNLMRLIAAEDDRRRRQRTVLMVTAGLFMPGLVFFLDTVFKRIFH